MLTRFRYVEVLVSRAVTIFDNRFTNSTIYEMRHFALIRELSTFFYTFNFFVGLFGGTLLYHRSPCPDGSWANNVPATKYLGDRRSPRSPSTTPLHLQHKICTKSHDVAFKISKNFPGGNTSGPQSLGVGMRELEPSCSCSARTGFRAVTTPL